MCTEVESEFVPEDVERDGIVQSDGVHEEQSGGCGQSVEGQRSVRISDGIIEHRVPDGTQLQSNANRQHSGLERIRYSHADE